MTEEDIKFYIQSLRDAEDEIAMKKRSGKSLKDCVGSAFETHRKRIWNYFGFHVVKDRDKASFHVDWTILYDGKIVAFEEDKGHYLDSCFLERALNGFAKTIHSYHKINETVPVLIIHSFTTYSKFQSKVEEDLETRKSEIATEMKNKLYYSTLCLNDRICKENWFKSVESCYTRNMNLKMIEADILFIQKLKR